MPLATALRLGRAQCWNQVWLPHSRVPASLVRQTFPPQAARRTVSPSPCSVRGTVERPDPLPLSGTPSFRAPQPRSVRRPARPPAPCPPHPTPTPRRPLPSPALPTPRLPGAPAPCPPHPTPSRRARPLPSPPIQSLPKHTPPPRIRPEPAVLTLGRSLPAFAARRPPRSGRRSTLTAAGPGGTASRERLRGDAGIPPSGDRRHSGHLVVLCRLPRGAAGHGRGLFSPRPREFAGGAGCLFPPLVPPAGALSFGCRADGRAVHSLLGTESVRRGFPTQRWGRRATPVPEFPTEEPVMGVSTPFTLGMVEGCPVPYPTISEAKLET